MRIVRYRRNREIFDGWLIEPNDSDTARAVEFLMNALYHFYSVSIDSTTYDEASRELPPIRETEMDI